MFGSNNWGQLGLGSKVTVNKPTCVKGWSLNSSLFPVLVQKGRVLCASAATDSCLQPPQREVKTEALRGGGDASFTKLF